MSTRPRLGSEGDIRVNSNSKSETHPLSDWNINEPVANNITLGFLINLRKKFYYLEILQNFNFFYLHRYQYTAVLSCIIVYLKQGHFFSLKSN